MPVIGCAVAAAYALAQFVAAIWGLETYVGWFAPIIITVCIYFRFSLPLTIFAFLGAKNDWGWHWLAALLFVAPGLLFLIPAVIGGVLDSARTALKRQT